MDFYSFLVPHEFFIFSSVRYSNCNRKWERKSFLIHWTRWLLSNNNFFSLLFDLFLLNFVLVVTFILKLNAINEFWWCSWSWKKQKNQKGKKMKEINEMNQSLEGRINWGTQTHHSRPFYILFIELDRLCECMCFNG